MASVSTDSNGNRRILFTNRDGQRKTVYVGAMPKKQVDVVYGKIESLNSAKITGAAPADEVARWATGIGDELHDKLAKVGLVDPRGNVNATSLAEFADQFIAGRSDKAEGTLIHYRQAKRLLVEFFGADRPLSAVTAHDADQFRSWLKGTKKTATGKSMAENTVRGHLKNSKLMFGSAVKARRISENPFNGISSQLVKRPDRMAFVEGETIQRVLNACPTARWRAIVVLCRYSGLRCPSEVFALRWSDVDFDRGRMRVRSPKGANFGKGIREVPLFPEVRSVLEVLFLEPDGGEFVITSKDRSSAKNLRTVFEKILRKAGVDPWPRLMQNLRSSRETELAREYPLQTVTAWLGNTPRVALENYLQVRDEDFSKASKTTRIPTQQASAGSTHSLATAHAENEQTPCFVGDAYKTRGVQDSSSAPTRART